MLKRGWFFHLIRLAIGSFLVLLTGWLSGHFILITGSALTLYLAWQFYNSLSQSLHLSNISPSLTDYATNLKQILVRLYFNYTFINVDNQQNKANRYIFIQYVRNKLNL